MRLTDDELRDVLARAEEIQRASRHGEEMNAELEAVIGAASILIQTMGRATIWR